MSWSKKYKKCKNCGTQRFPHKLLGCCSNCYYPEKRIKEVELWNFNKPETLKGYPRNTIFHNLKDFEKIRGGFLKQYKDRLFSIKYDEEKLQTPISGHDLEFKIREVAILSGVDGGLLFFGKADFFNHQFDDKQLKIIYEMLHSIIESKKWKGIDWYKIFNNDKY